MALLASPRSQAKVQRGPAKAQRAEIKLEWEQFLLQNTPDIKCMAATESDDVFVLTDETLSCYKASFPCRKIFEREFSMESVNAIAMVTSKIGGVDFLVKLDAEQKVMRFHSLKGKSQPYDYVSKFQTVPKKPYEMLASAGPYVCYPYTETHTCKIVVGFLMAQSETPDVFEVGNPIQVPYLWLCAMCMYVHSILHNSKF